MSLLWGASTRVAGPSDDPPNSGFSGTAPSARDDAIPIAKSGAVTRVASSGAAATVECSPVPSGSWLPSVTTGLFSPVVMAGLMTPDDAQREGSPVTSLIGLVGGGAGSRVASTAASASSKASADAKRASGFFAMARMTTSASRAGQSGCTTSTRRGGW